MSQTFDLNEYDQMPLKVANGQKIDPMYTKGSNVSSMVELEKCNMQPVLIAERLTALIDGRLYIKKNNYNKLRYESFAKIGPWKLDDKFLNQKEFQNLFAQRLIPMGEPWYYEPLRFKILNASFGPKGFLELKRPTSDPNYSKESFECHMVIPEGDQITSNIVEFDEFAKKQIIDGLNRGDVSYPLKYYPSYYKFEELDDGFASFLDWCMPELLHGLPIKKPFGGMFEGSLDGVKQKFTVEQFNDFVKNHYFMDAVIRPSVWIMKSKVNDSIEVRAGTVYRIEHIAVRTPLERGN